MDVDAASTRRVDAPVEAATLTEPATAEVEPPTQQLEHAGELLRLAADAGGVGLWEIDIDSGRARWDQTLRAMLGVGPDHPASLESWLAFLPPEDRHVVAEAYPDGLYDRDLVCRIVALDGTLRHLLIRGYRLASAPGNVLVGTAVDVTAVTLAQHHVSTTLELLDEAYIAIDARGGITHVNSHAVRLFPIPEDRLIGADLAEVFDLGPDLSRCLRSAAVSRHREHLEVWHDPLAMWLEARIAPLQDGGLVLFLRDIGRRKGLEAEREELLTSEQHARRLADESRAEIAHREAHDPVTDAMSRGEIERRSAQLATTGGHLVTLDLDNFRRINELGGWDTGDDILREVVARMQVELSDQEFLGRRSGDRFLVVTRRQDANEVQRLVTALLATFEAPFQVLGQPEHLTATTGVARVDADQDPTDALRGTDAVIARLARFGGGRVGWYDDHAHNELIERRRLTSELREAIVRESLVLRFQPIFDLRTRRYAGSDALLRWEHPTRGSILPAFFLSIAEEMGLGRRIAHHVLDTAIVHLGEWERERDPERRRARPPILWVALAATHVSSAGFAEEVLAALRAVNVEPSRLGIDLIQPGFDSDVSHLLEQLTQLRRAGVRVSLDLVGAGNVGHNVLHRLPLDVLRFSGDLHFRPSSRRSQALVRATIELGRALEAEVQGLGIETREQLDALGRAGIDLVTGPLLGRPVPPGELADVVAEGLPLIDGGDARGGTRGRQAWWKLGLGSAAAPTDDEPIADAQIVAGDRDGVTGLAGHRSLVKVLAEHVEAGRRPVLILLELDSFAALSLARGVDFTEALLRAQARRLHALEGARSFRLERGRFALVLPDTRRGPVSSQVDLGELSKGPKGLTVSVGIAHARSGATPSELEHHAEEALRAARRRGHGQVIDQRASEEATPTATPAQARALYAVLREGYLRVHYQPIISLGDGSIVGFQALARPQLDHGLAGPAEAFEVAENLGLAPELDVVCRSSILTDGPGFDLPANTSMYITVAPQALGHQSLRSGQLIREVRAAGLVPERVVLQLREHPSVPAAVFDEEARWLKDRGFQLALDGAGGQTSGLRALAAVPFDHVKLATNLLADARESPNAEAMLEALCSFAVRTGVKVIATGIETPRLLTFARKLRGSSDGVPRLHAAQGYHLGKPRPQPRADIVLEPL